MRKIATIAAVMALVTAEAGVSAQSGAYAPGSAAVPPGSAGEAGPAAEGAAGAPAGSASFQTSNAAGTGPAGTYDPDSRRRRRFVDDPRKIILSLAALTEFILAFAIAVKGKHGGRPASP